MIKTLRRVVLVTGLMGLTMFGSPFIQDNPIMDFISNTTTITAMAAEQPSDLPYSYRWETQADNSWKYKLNDGAYATGWIQDEVDHNWYYMDSNAVMKSGLCVSYGKYYLLSEEHDGHFGHMIKNGEVYKGIQITADTSSGTEGALSDEMIARLGLDKSKAFDVTGSQHVTDGEVTPPTPAQEQTPSNETSSSSGQTSSERRQSQRDKYGEDATFGSTGDDPFRTRH